MLVYCGRNVEAGRCAGMYSNKKYVAKRKLFADDSPRSEKKSNTPKKSQTVKKSVSFSPTIKKSSLNSGEGSSRDARKSPQSPKWTKKQSFQIKSLHPEHKCSRTTIEDPCGELLIAMGRDANNQMYPIAWAVVRVENLENWGWFLALLHDDLKLQQGTGLTLISDGHKKLDCISKCLSAIGSQTPNLSSPMLEDHRCFDAKIEAIALPQYSCKFGRSYHTNSQKEA
ncbi:splicing factor [Tanacetum coccineum]